MRIENSDLVLEVGSGDMPYPRADILCDRYHGKTSHRRPNAKLIIDRPMVIADIQDNLFSVKHKTARTLERLYWRTTQR